MPSETVDMARVRRVYARHMKVNDPDSAEDVEIALKLLLRNAEKAYQDANPAPEPPDPLRGPCDGLTPDEEDADVECREARARWREGTP